MTLRFDGGTGPGPDLVALGRLARDAPREAVATIEHLMESVTDPVIRAELRRLHGSARWKCGAVADGLAEIRQAAAELAVIGSPERHANCLIELGEAEVNLTGDLSAATEAIERARDLAEQHGLPKVLGQALGALGQLLGRLGRLDEAEQILRAAIEQLGELDDGTTYLPVARLNLGYVHVELGHLDEALELLIPLQRHPIRGLRIASEQSIAQAYGRLGRTDEAIALLDAQRDTLDAGTDLYDWPGNLAVRGEILLAAGHPDLAIEPLQEALRYARDHDLAPTELEVLEMLARAFQDAGRLPEALTAERDVRVAERRVLDQQVATRAQVMQAGSLLREAQAAREALASANEELERRVLDRTAALQAEVIERRAAEDRARFWAEHDWLTGVLNRNSLDAVLVDLLGDRSATKAVGDPTADPDALPSAAGPRPRGSGGAVFAAVLFVDLDGFKHVNDMYGHMAGDEVLKVVARRVDDIVGERWKVARFGGDEFVVVSPPFASDVDVAGAAVDMGERIRRSLAAEIRWAGRQVTLTASIGIAVNGGTGTAGDDLIRLADQAMFHAKRQGGDRCALLDADARRLIERHATLRRDLGRAILGGELEAWLQPVVDARSGAAHHFELLARWHHPELGWVPPSEFVPVAEESDAILALGRWALGEAVHCATVLSAAGEVTVGVNLSTIQLSDPRIVEELLAVVADRGGRTDRIVLELTESVQLSDDPGSTGRIEALKASGFRLAIDDFGTGYSSFDYLSRLHVDQLKIDRSLVLAAETTREGAVVVDAIVAVAGALGIVTVAEGVETVAQRDLLVAKGIDALQGFLFARPMPMGQVVDWLATRGRGTSVGSGDGATPGAVSISV